MMDKSFTDIFKNGMSRIKWSDDIKYVEYESEQDEKIIKDENDVVSIVLKRIGYVEITEDINIIFVISFNMMEYQLTIGLNLDHNNEFVSFYDMETIRDLHNNVRNLILNKYNIIVSTINENRHQFGINQNQESIH